MTPEDYRNYRDAALAKAFAAPNLKVRLAYFDLAEFYDVCARKTLFLEQAEQGRRGQVASSRTGISPYRKGARHQLQIELLKTGVGWHGSSSRPE